jgi:hypothetical protein
MKRLVGLAICLIAVPVIGASATTAQARVVGSPGVSVGSVWTVATPHLGCENVKFLNHHKFVADQFGDGGTWAEPTHNTITMHWTEGSSIATVFKGTFASSTGRYNGHIHFGTGSHSLAELRPGATSGC